MSAPDALPEEWHVLWDGGPHWEVHAIEEANRKCATGPIGTGEQ